MCFLFANSVNYHRLRRWLEDCPGRCAVTGFISNSISNSKIPIDSVRFPYPCPPPNSHVPSSLPQAKPIPSLVSNYSPVANNMKLSQPQKPSIYISDRRQYDARAHKSYVLTSENDSFCTSLFSAAPSREVQIYRCFTISPTVKPSPWTTTRGSGLRYELTVSKVAVSAMFRAKNIHSLTIMFTNRERE